MARYLSLVTFRAKLIAKPSPLFEKACGILPHRRPRNTSGQGFPGGIDFQLGPSVALHFDNRMEDSMEKQGDNTPSSNNLKLVKGKTDRSYDTTNELRGDRKFADEFAARTTYEADTETFKNPHERENPNARNKNKDGLLLGSREDSLEIDDEK